MDRSICDPDLGPSRIESWSVTSHRLRRYDPAVLASGSSTQELPLPAELGETVGAYRLTEVIGRGGMGCVYRGVHRTIGRVAAIKVMYPWLSIDEGYTARLKTEAKIVNDLRHPNVVDILDFVRTEAPHRVSCVMELLEGPTLAQVLEQHSLTPVQALNVALQLADALSAVHARGIVHRDIKPANIGVVASLESDMDTVPSVKLLDFGIAKVADSTVAHTVSAAALGTPAYMAPEQVAAEPVTAATDIYALMEVLSEMLTRRRVFEGEGLTMMRKKMAGPSPPIRLPSDLIGWPMLQALIEASLAVDPGERPLLGEIVPRLRTVLARQQRWEYRNEDEVLSSESV